MNLGAARTPAYTNGALAAIGNPTVLDGSVPSSLNLMPCPVGTKMANLAPAGGVRDFTLLRDVICSYPQGFQLPCIDSTVMNTSYPRTPRSGSNDLNRGRRGAIIDLSSSGLIIFSAITDMRQNADPPCEYWS